MGTVVLVHGAWHGAWCWDRVTEELQARGMTATAVELPLTGFADDADAARTAIEAAGDGAVVCAHSYGGMVVSQAAAGLLNVRRLVFLAALQMDQGEDPVALQSMEPSLLFDALIYGEENVTVDPARVHQVFYEDSDPALVATISRRLRPMPTKGALVVTAEPAWKSIPSTYVLCTRDKAISPTLQRVLAARANEVVEWDTDHSPFLTRPRDLANLLASY